MTTRVSALILLATTAVLGTACGIEHKNTPASPTTTTTTTTTTSSSTTSTTTSYVGTWASTTVTSSTLPTSCGNFEWTVSSQTATSISGAFSATCGIFAVSGTASGQLNGQAVTVSVSGSGTAAGVASCGFSLNGTGTIQNDTLPIAYSGTTCLGPVQGTETLRRSTPVVIDAPAAVSPSNGVTVSSTQPTLIVSNASRSGPAGSITYLFQVSTDTGFGTIAASGSVAEQSGQTSYTPSDPLAAGTTYHWRARASDPSHTGPWSGVQTFVTPSSFSSSPGFDLGQAVIVVGPKAFASWAETSTITSVTQGNGTLCIQHTMLGRWPTVPFFGDPSTLVEGNQWYFALIGGVWYGGAGEWVRPGQACKGFGGGPEEFYDASQEPLHSWTPRSGDLVGIAASTPARAWPNMATVDERTNVVLIRWQ